MLWRLTWLLENIKTYYLKKKSRHYLYKIDISRGIHCIVFKEYTMTQTSVQFSSVTQSYLTLRPHGLQHARPPCPSPTPGACSNSCPSNQWCHPTISSSVIPFSSCLQSFTTSGSFQHWCWKRIIIQYLMIIEYLYYICCSTYLHLHSLV